jgi:hypothetical protein
MFSRNACYFFVRPQKSFLEIWFFLGRRLKDPRVRNIVQTSSVKFGHQIRLIHRDQVESPITDWLKEAYTVCEQLHPSKAAKASKRKAVSKKKPSIKRSRVTRRSR